MFSRIIHTLRCAFFSTKRDIFYKDLSDSLRRRVSLKLFATRLYENSKLLKDKNNEYVAKSLLNKIESGREVKLEKLLRGLVPNGDLILIRSAEQSRNVPDSIDHLAAVVDFKWRLRKAVIGQLVIITATSILTAGVSKLTADIITEIVDSAPQVIFTGFNGFVVTLSNIINSYGLHIVICILIAFALIVYGAPRFFGNWRHKVDELPLLGLYRDVQSANNIAALSMLLSSGLVLKDAIINLSKSANPWTKWQLSKVINSLDTAPNKLMHAFGHGLFSRELRGRLASLSDSTSSFENAIIHLGRIELDRIEQQIKKTILVSGSLTVMLVATVAVVLALGQNTIITQLYNELSKGY